MKIIRRYKTEHIIMRFFFLSSFFCNFCVDSSFIYHDYKNQNEIFLMNIALTIKWSTSLSMNGNNDISGYYVWMMGFKIWSLATPELTSQPSPALFSGKYIGIEAEITLIQFRQKQKKWGSVVIFCLLWRRRKKIGEIA